MKRGIVATLLGVIVLGVLLTGLVHVLNRRDEDPLTSATVAMDAAAIERGAYLARAGNCMGCHTLRGGTPYAGGRGVPTPFGTIYAPNLTPDREHGIGAWTAAEFWRALHNGRGRDGRLLYPAFPYPNYTRMTRADADAIYAYLMSLPPSPQADLPDSLRFPFDRQAALAVWRALYFSPARYAADERKPADWNRGAYLVEGLGHCNACHSARNAFGATSGPFDLAGGLIPVQNWYAPSLASAQEAGVADWDTRHVVDLLKTGVSPRGAVMGPMVEVVGGSTQYLSDTDLRAMAVYLKSLPQAPAVTVDVKPPRGATLAAGERLYAKHCAACHGDRGEGAPGIYPALAGSRAVNLQSPANLVHLVLEGGFPPSTTGNSRPFGMPPFAPVLNDDELAQLLSFLRSSWGNRADEVTSFDVERYRNAR